MSASSVAMDQKDLDIRSETQIDLAELDYFVLCALRRFDGWRGNRLLPWMVLLKVKLMNESDE